MNSSTDFHKDVGQVPAEETVRPPLRIEIFTLFPGMFTGPLSESIILRAVGRELVKIAIHNIRDWTTDRHRTADDTPYGGGAGMVLTAPPIIAAVESVLGSDLSNTRIVLLAAGGHRFDQRAAWAFSRERRIALICGHYEGIDERVAEILGAEQWSIGDFVLTGGELPAMVMVDAITRLLPGVIEANSIEDESHEAGLIEYPHYTRPASVRGMDVPDVLISGHHARIREWRREQSIRRTARWRPDLLAGANLSAKEIELAREEVERPASEGDKRR
jgi:tRNA (guanine37-N1)-methyltransferase